MAGSTGINITNRSSDGILNSTAGPYHHPTDPEFIYSYGYQALYSHYEQRPQDLRVPPRSAVHYAQQAIAQLEAQLSRGHFHLLDEFPLPVFHYYSSAVDPGVYAVLVFQKTNSATFYDILTFLGTFEQWASEWGFGVPGTQVTFSQINNVDRWILKGSAHFKLYSHELDGGQDQNATAVEDMPTS